MALIHIIIKTTREDGPAVDTDDLLTEMESAIDEIELYVEDTSFSLSVEGIGTTAKGAAESRQRRQLPAAGAQA